MAHSLHGRTIVVTRPRAQASQLAAWIGEQGGEARAGRRGAGLPAARNRRRG